MNLDDLKTHVWDIILFVGFIFFFVVNIALIVYVFTLKQDITLLQEQYEILKGYLLNG